MAYEPATAAAVAALVRACSGSALRRRFFLPVEPTPDEILGQFGRYLLVDPLNRGRRTALDEAELRDQANRLPAQATSYCMLFPADT